ncbi:stomatin family protein [Microthyrium microscopicum]|uniref:Stomatin family protein n=1 Tax=Microthyrium microscopicum TaxID=703497 RepID=A0A6A6UH84_9PEZI|nr:stomatin family protein [Microthyrium microscopicum]
MASASTTDPSVSKAPINGNNGNHNNAVHDQLARRDYVQPSYATKTDPHEDAGSHGWYGGMINGLGSIIGTCGAIPCCVVCPNPYRPVQQGAVGLITKFGRFSRAVDPGLIKINPLSEKVIMIDVKMQIVEVPQQTCMTKDNVTLHLSSVLYYRITSPHKAAFGIADIRRALIERTQTTLRHVIGARVLQDVIERREEIAQDIRNIVEDVAEGWGAEVESMLIRDIVFSSELQESLSMAAQAKRSGEAKVIAARAEVESAKLMRQAADILSSAPAMQIRYLEAMQAMARSANSKVIFLPATNQTVQAQLSDIANNNGQPLSQPGSSSSPPGNEYGSQDAGFQSAINSHIIEHM